MCATAELEARPGLDIAIARDPSNRLFELGETRRNGGGARRPPTRRDRLGRLDLAVLDG